MLDFGQKGFHFVPQPRRYSALTKLQLKNFTFNVGFLVVLDGSIMDFVIFCFNGYIYDTLFCFY